MSLVCLSRSLLHVCRSPSRCRTPHPALHHPLPAGARVQRLELDPVGGGAGGPRRRRGRGTTTTTRTTT
eukprot:6110454-Pyramimonas_sp.AAC.1